MICCFATQSSQPSDTLRHRALPQFEQLIDHPYAAADALLEEGHVAPDFPVCLSRTWFGEVRGLAPGPNGRDQELDRVAVFRFGHGGVSVVLVHGVGRQIPHVLSLRESGSRDTRFAAVRLVDRHAGLVPLAGAPKQLAGSQDDPLDILGVLLDVGWGLGRRKARGDGVRPIYDL